MIITDTHLHSSISSDSQTPMKDMVEAAISCGLTDIYFTEHMDYEFPKSHALPFVFDPDEYFRKTDECKQMYGSKINIHSGIELGLKDNLKKDYTELLADYPWDYVIGSTHLVDDLDPYYDEYWENRNVYEAIKEYFVKTYNNINAFCNFDSLGHLDYILRYARSEFDKEYVYKDCADLIDSILKFIIEKDIALEINTSGYRSKLKTPNPDIQLIRCYIELGGEKITIGSDAHSPENIAIKYDQLEKLLRDNGITQYYSYVNRKPIIHNL